MAKELDVSWVDFVQLTLVEVKQGLRQGSLSINKEEFKERSEGFVYLMEGGQGQLISGDEGKRLADWIDQYVGGMADEVDEIKGQPVSPGVVKGIVRLAHLAKDSYEIKEGEILVCSMTSPDYVPAMRRATAIVTDEGGLLSHAAIVSREMGKPCVVGTKIATQVLKDGDVVEVDADKGVVRIINRAS